MAQTAQAVAGASVLVALVWAGGSLPALAEASDWAASDHAQARLIAATEGVAGSGILSLGLHIRLEEGWETSWRSPGDAGIPPQLDWDGSENIDEIVIDWPLPRRFSVLGMNTFGYLSEVVLQLTALVSDPGQGARLRLHLSYAVCREICILVEADLALDISAGPAPDNAALAARIDRFSATVPVPGSADFAVERVSVLAGPTPEIQILARSGRPFQAPDVIIEAPPGFAFQPPEVRLIEGGRRAVLHAAYTASSLAPVPLSGHMVTVTLFDGARATERTLPALPAE